MYQSSPSSHQECRVLFQTYYFSTSAAHPVLLVSAEGLWWPMAGLLSPGGETSLGAPTRIYYYSGLLCLIKSLG